ncbi:MAG: hypothetical protein RRY41_04810, partial [Burkholderiaceae bacterium]
MTNFLQQTKKEGGRWPPSRERRPQRRQGQAAAAWCQISQINPINPINRRPGRLRRAFSGSTAPIRS